MKRKKMNKELWVTIFDSYEVSNYGRIRNKLTGRLLGGTLRPDGYYQVSLSQANTKKKVYLVHRLIAMAFIQNPENKPQVDHIDGNKQNNNASNLRWATDYENQHNPNTFDNIGFKNKGYVNIGNHWFTNGLENRFTKICPEGFTRGRVFKKCLNLT